jgi:RND superfamily putative drug exporter
MLYRIGQLTVRFRWPIIILWVALIAALVPFAIRSSSELKAGFGTAGTESGRAVELIREDLGVKGSTINLVFFSDTLTLQDPRYIREMEEVLASVRGLPDVRQVSSPVDAGNADMVSGDGHTAYATIFLDVELDAAMDIYPEIKERAQHTENLRVWATGGIPIVAEIRDYSESDLQRAEMVTFPLVLVALVVVFGGLVAAGIPVALGGASVGITLGLLYFIAQATEMSIFSLNLISLLGLGVAIDYSLLMVNRFREECARHTSHEAVARTMATAGRSIIFSGVTSALGLSGLLLFRIMMLSSLGLGGIMVILVSLLVATTFLPALLAVVGKKVDALSIVPVVRRETGGWRRLASWVMRHPVMVMVPVMVFLLLLGTPSLGIKIGAPWSAILPPGSEAKEGWDVASRELGPGELAPLLVVAHTEGEILAPESIGALYDFAEQVTGDARVRNVESIVSIDPGFSRQEYQAILSNIDRFPPPVREEVLAATGEHTTLMKVYSKYGPMDDETKALLNDIRSTELGDDVTIYVAGETAELEDSIGIMYGNFPRVVLYVLGTIYLALLVLFRSAVLALKAVLMNAMSIFASYGALVFIFQQGHFQGLLGFEASGYLEPTIPIILFCILFGLSMDYEVFLLSRVKEAYDRTGDNTGSVAEGLQRTGGIITSAALILILVAASFSTGQIVLIKALGIGIAIAIFLDVTLVRALLVPALMRILGEWNWWAPGFIKRWIPRWQVPD